MKDSIALRNACTPDDLTPADYQRVDALICAPRKNRGYRILPNRLAM